MPTTDHRAEAERQADGGLDGDYGDDALRDRRIAYAQVHATLALAEALDEVVAELGRARVALEVLAGADLDRRLGLDRPRFAGIDVIPDDGVIG